MAGDTDRIKRRVQAALTAALTTFVEDVGGEAQRRAPLEEGTLRGSMETDVTPVTTATGLMLEGEVTFNEIYAARQHEEDDWHHDEGQADYLGSVMRERAPRLEAAVGTAMKRALS